MQCAGAGGQQCQPVAEYVARCHGALQATFDRFYPPGVDGNVLGGRAERDQQGKQRQLCQVAARVGECHAGQTGGDGDLGCQHPAATLAEYTGQQREWQAVNNRRPEDLD